MASPFDVTRHGVTHDEETHPLTFCSLYDSPIFSDISIKFSGREVKCHKVVLYQGSDYFKALCGPDSQFAESNQKVIELQDDDPDAVEMVLRHIYNFPYDVCSQLPRDPKFHLNVYIAAEKYLVNTLPTLALDAFFESVAAEIEVAEREGKMSAVFEIASMLDSRREEHERCGKLCDTIVSNNLPDLLTLPEFRNTLIEDGNQQTWGLIAKAMKLVKKYPNLLDETKGESTHFECWSCGFSRIGGVERPSCTSCGAGGPRWWRVTRWKEI